MQEDRMPSPRRSLLLRLLALLSLAFRTEGQEADRTVPAGFVDGWHIVRPGETLELIATRYTGNLSLWREIHRLNPGIADPDLIEPGQRILPSPRLVGPEPGSELACSNPVLQWEPVPEAQSYTVEICRDPGCGELVERQAGLTTAEWQAEGLPTGALHWRVTARSRSGLDGYPSEPAGLAITSGEADLQPPTGTLRLTGPQVRVDGRLFVASAPVPEVAAEDAETGVSRWLPVIDGEAGAAWPASWDAGEHTAAALVVDRCGRRGTLAPVAFIVDSEPPSIRSETGSLASFEERMPEPRRESRTRRREKKQKDPDPGALLWSSGWDRWETLAGEVEIPSDSLQLFFRAPAGRSFDGGEVLYLHAEDAGARLDRVRFRSRSAPEGIVLEVEAVDLVGNVVKKEWVVAGRTR
jgi:hypothetical protein